MRRTILTGLMLALVSAAPLAAQGAPPRRPDRVGPGGPDAAEQFLARTGELRLTDAQVTRLAAIARRSQDRRRAMATRLDSLAPRPITPPRDSAARAARRTPMDSAARAARQADVDRMRSMMEQQREQARADLRDALAVLTPEQLAIAWEMRGAGGPPQALRRSGRTIDRPVPRRDVAPARPVPARPRPDLRRPPRDSR